MAVALVLAFYLLLHRGPAFGRRAAKTAAVALGVAWPMVALELAADAAALVLCGLGLVLMPASRLRGILAVLFGVVFVVHGATLAYPRYHVPLVIIGLGAAGYAAAEGLPALRARGLSRRQWAALAVVAAALLTSWARTALLYLVRGQ